MSAPDPVRFACLKDLSVEQIRTLAVSATAPAMEGTWVLTAPNGREYIAESPMGCWRAEQHERIPAKVALARIYVATFLDSDLDEEGL